MKKTIILLACIFSLTRLGSEELPQGLSTDAALLARISGLFELEDPTSIYNFSIKDKEVEFILDGTWGMDLSSALHISFSKDLTTYTFVPPVFAQTVNMSSWIFIDNAWYFESSFAEEFTRNTVAAGYVGNDDTVIKHVRIGNSGIKFPDKYPFVQVGGGLAIAPGIMGTFAGKNWNADAIVRYDAAAMKNLVLSGMNEVTDTLIPVTSPVRGKWFILPDAPVTGAVSVFVEDEKGTHSDSKGRKWRELSMSEFRVSGISGILELDDATSSSVAVVYDGNYTTPSSKAGPSLIQFVHDTYTYFTGISGTAIDSYLSDTPNNPIGGADSFITTIDGQNALLIRERGYFSPFDTGFKYAASGSDLDAVYASSGLTPDWFVVDSYNNSFAEISLSNTINDGIEYIRTPEARFPLARAFPLLYFPAFGGKKIETDLAIRSRTYSPVSTISLGDEVIAGTIQVTRNGVTDTAFTFDESSGSLTLAKQPQSNENIKISWLNTDLSARNATLTLAGGIKWKPVPSIELTGASAFRWNMSKDGFTDSGQNSPGSYVVTSGISWTGTRANASTSFAFDITVPDTTGFYRILGMDSNTRTIYPSNTWYEPIPSFISPVLGKPYHSAPPPSDILDRAERVELEGTNGKTLPTITDSTVSGAVLSLSCSLSALSNWAGADILAGTYGDVDFSSAKTVTIALRNAGPNEDFDVFLQLGINKDESFEDASTIRTWKLDTPAHGSGWITVSRQLTDDDRRSLTAGKEMRLIVRPSVAATPSALNPLKIKLYSGPFDITDSDFETSPASIAGTAATDWITATETANPDESSSAEGSSFNTVINRFNSGAKNTVLKTEFTWASGSKNFSIHKSITAIPLSSYNQFSFFIYAPLVPPSLSGRVIRFLLSKPGLEGTGADTACEFEIDPWVITPAAWHRITIDLSNKKILEDGNALTDAQARIIKLDRSLLPTHIDISFENWPTPSPATWAVYFDELFLEGSNPVYTGRNETDFGWKKTGPILSAGKTALVSDTSFSVRTASSITAGASDPVIEGSITGGISLLKAKLDGSLSASSASEKYLETTSHNALIPVGPLTAKESYSIDLGANSLQREDALSFSGFLNGGYSVSERHSGMRLERKEAANLSPAIPKTPIGTFSFSADTLFSQTGMTPLEPIKKMKWDNLWTHSFPLLLSQGESDASDRNGMTNLKTGWTSDNSEIKNQVFGLSGVQFDTSYQSLYASHSQTGYGSNIGFKLAIPFTVLNTTLTPEWNRTVEENRIMQTGGSYFTDSKILLSSFDHQRWLFLVPPVADLIKPDMKDEIRDIGTWSRIFTNKYGLSWKRPAAGMLYDLYIPSTINASIQRKTETDASTVISRDIWSAPVNASFQALNIAGTFGILHLFSWYEQDEIDQLYGWTAHWGDGSFLWSIDTWHSITLFFPDTSTVSAENAYHYDSPDIAQKNELTKDTVKLIWKRKGTDSFVDILLRKMTTFELTTRREDSASFSFTMREIDTSNFTYDHMLATGIGKNGELRLSAGTGCTTSHSKLESIDVRLGIGGKLTY